jgi:hypothetical protein
VSERLGDIGPEGDLHYWVNDGLMAFFFFVVGLEVRRLRITSARGRGGWSADMFTVTSWDLLCVPSEKGVVAPTSLTEWARSSPHR